MAGRDDAIQAIAQVPTLSRRRCRQTFEERFSATQMTQDYVRIYQQLLEPRTQRTAA